MRESISASVIAYTLLQNLPLSSSRRLPVKLHVTKEALDMNLVDFERLHLSKVIDKLSYSFNEVKDISITGLELTDADRCTGLDIVGWSIVKIPEQDGFKNVKVVIYDYKSDDSFIISITYDFYRKIEYVDKFKSELLDIAQLIISRLGTK